MSELENADIENWDKFCIVCNKNGEGDHGMAHVKVGDRMIALCCPMCFDMFEKNAKHYLGLRIAHEMNTQLLHSAKS